MEKVRLGDVCTINGGYAFKSDQFSTEGVPVIRIGNITKEGLIIDEDVCYDEKFWNENDSYRIAKNDILIAMSGATVGKSCINNTERKLLLNQRVAAINCDNNINLKYIFYSIDSEKFSKYIMTNSIGCAQPNISLKQIANFEISAVCLEEQNRIADELDKVTDVINKRKQQISKLDELVKARFVELFGDPMTNSNGYVLKKYGDLFELNAGGTPSKQKSEYWDNGTISWIGSNMCQNTVIYENDGNYITEEGLKHSSARMFPVDTVLIALVGATIGKTALLKFETTTNQNVLGVRGIRESGYTPEFVFYYTQGLYQKFLDIGDGGFSMASKGFISELPVPVVDLALQEQFAAFVKQTDKSKLEIQKSLEKLELLKKALMQKYFG